MRKELPIRLDFQRLVSVQPQECTSHIQICPEIGTRFHVSKCLFLQSPHVWVLQTFVLTGWSLVLVVISDSCSALWMCGHPWRTKTLTYWLSPWLQPCSTSLSIHTVPWLLIQHSLMNSWIFTLLFCLTPLGFLLCIFWLPLIALCYSCTL